MTSSAGSNTARGVLPSAPRQTAVATRQPGTRESRSRAHRWLRIQAARLRFHVRNSAASPGSEKHWTKPDSDTECGSKMVVIAAPSKVLAVFVDELVSTAPREP